MGEVLRPLPGASDARVLLGVMSNPSNNRLRRQIRRWSNQFLSHGRGVDAGLAGPARALEGLVELAELVARPPLRVRVPARARRGRDALALVRREFPDELDLGPQAVEGHEGVAHVLQVLAVPGGRHG